VKACDNAGCALTLYSSEQVNVIIGMSTGSLQAILDWITANPGWMGIVIFLTALAESLALVGLIVPGAVMMFGFGALIALGHLNFWIALSYAVAGAVVGDGLSFWLGRAFHQRLRGLWPFSKHPETLTRSEAFFHRHGSKSVLLGRFFGPVRAVIPAVAGMLHMPVGRFLVVNVISALLWAPAYLFPGMVFAASLELASQVAWRLVVLILLLVGLLWLTVLLVRSLFRLLHPRVSSWLQDFLIWGQEHPLIRPISASLLDPTQGELRGLSTLAVLLLGMISLLSLSMKAVEQNLPTALDQSLYRFLQDLRTPWADQLMVLLTELGDYQVKLPLVITVFAWLYWNRFHSAAWHWLAVLSLGLVANAIFNGLLPIAVEVDQGLVSDSFVSHQVTLTTILFGFLAVLLARETPPARRWIPYLTAALIVTAITFSRLYLGAHWLTGALAGLSLGLIWVSLLGLAYNHHPAPSLERRGLVLVCLFTLFFAALLHTGLHYNEALQRYKPRPDLQILSKDEWWQGGWQRLPNQRLDFRGKRRQDLVLQWAASFTELQQRLGKVGWQVAPALTLQSTLMFLNPQAQLADLPVLPQVHDGRHDELTLVYPGETPASHWILRFWDSGLRLREDNIPVWLGSLSLQRLVRRIDVFSLAEDIPYSKSPREMLQPVLQGLPSQTVNLTGNIQTVILIAPPKIGNR
jgi:undecaprenyl-diphosphatase